MMNVRMNLNRGRSVSPIAYPGPFHRRSLRVVAGVDWSGDSLAGVRASASLYVPDELVLVHAVPSSSMESRSRTDKARVRACVSRESLQQHSIAAGKRSLTWVSALVHRAVPSTREVCHVGTPAGVLLDTARAVGAELIVVGQRGARENLDGTIGSVSHEVCLNADCSTLVVRKGHGTPRRVVALIQHSEDVVALRRWLRAVPFREPTDLTVLCLMTRPVRGEPIGPLSVQFWNDAAMNNARSLLNPLIRDLERPQLRITGRIVREDPATIVLREGVNFDLLMLHGSDRKGRDPRRSGMPWRALLRIAPCSTLIVRAMSADTD